MKCQNKTWKNFNLKIAKPVATPMLKESGSQQPKKEVEKFVGAHIYPMVGTQPDLAYCVSYLSRSLDNPTTEDVR